MTQSLLSSPQQRLPQSHEHHHHHHHHHHQQQQQHDTQTADDVWHAAEQWGAADYAVFYVPLDDCLWYPEYYESAARRQHAAVTYNADGTRACIASTCHCDPFLTTGPDDANATPPCDGTCDEGCEAHFYSEETRRWHQHLVDESALTVRYTLLQYKMEHEKQWARQSAPSTSKLQCIFPTFMLQEPFVQNVCPLGSELTGSMVAQPWLIGARILFPCMAMPNATMYEKFVPEHYMWAYYTGNVALLSREQQDKKRECESRLRLETTNIGLVWQCPEQCGRHCSLEAVSVHTTADAAGDATTPVYAPPLDEVYYVWRGVDGRYDTVPRKVLDVLMVEPIRQAVTGCPNWAHLELSADDGRQLQQQLQAFAGNGRVLERRHGNVRMHVPLLPHWYSKNGEQPPQLLDPDHKRIPPEAWGDCPDQFGIGSVYDNLRPCDIDRQERERCAQEIMNGNFIGREVVYSGSGSVLTITTAAAPGGGGGNKQLSMDRFVAPGRTIANHNDDDVVVAAAATAKPTVLLTPAVAPVTTASNNNNKTVKKPAAAKPKSNGKTKDVEEVQIEDKNLATFLEDELVRLLGYRKQLQSALDGSEITSPQNRKRVSDQLKQVVDDIDNCTKVPFIYLRDRLNKLSSQEKDRKSELKNRYRQLLNVLDKEQRAHNARDNREDAKLLQKMRKRFTKHGFVRMKDAQGGDIASDSDEEYMTTELLDDDDEEDANGDVTPGNSDDDDDGEDITKDSDDDEDDEDYDADEADEEGTTIERSDDEQDYGAQAPGAADESDELQNSPEAVCDDDGSDNDDDSVPHSHVTRVHQVVDATKNDGVVSAHQRVARREPVASPVRASSPVATDTIMDAKPVGRVTGTPRAGVKVAPAAQQQQQQSAAGKPRSGTAPSRAPPPPQASDEEEEEYEDDGEEDQEDGTQAEEEEEEEQEAEEEEDDEEQEILPATQPKTSAPRAKARVGSQGGSTAAARAVPQSVNKELWDDEFQPDPMPTSEPPSGMDVAASFSSGAHADSDGAGGSAGKGKSNKAKSAGGSTSAVSGKSPSKAPEDSNGTVVAKQPPKRKRSTAPPFVELSDAERDSLDEEELKSYKRRLAADKAKKTKMLNSQLRENQMEDDAKTVAAATCGSKRKTSSGGENDTTPAAKQQRTAAASGVQRASTPSGDPLDSGLEGLPGYTCFDAQTPAQKKRVRGWWNTFDVLVKKSCESMHKRDIGMRDDDPVWYTDLYENGHLFLDKKKCPDHSTVQRMMKNYFAVKLARYSAAPTVYDVDVDLDVAEPPANTQAVKDYISVLYYYDMYDKDNMDYELRIPPPTSEEEEQQQQDDGVAALDL